MRGRKLSNGRYLRSYTTELAKPILEKMIDDGLSAYQIADKIGCSVKTVYSYIKFHNIEYDDKRGIIQPNTNYGLLTTISVVGKTKNGILRWLCKCTCGKEFVTLTTMIKNGRTKSCGCWRARKRNHAWKGYCGISGARVSEIRLRARKHNMDFTLTPEFLWNLWVKQNQICAISGLPIDLDISASVDRIDSKLGYIQSNVWWVHKDINKMKMDIPLNQFLTYCQIISSHNKEPSNGCV